MGYHADVYKGFADLIIEAVPSDMPTLNMLTASETEFDRHARSVLILRESIDYEPHPEINPRTAVEDQAETWEWVLYITGGGGTARSTDGGAEVDLYLEMIKTALNAQRPTSDCGPMHLTSEDFEGRDGAKVTYTQRWTHRRRE
jgi:hypothetical protein